MMGAAVAEGENRAVEAAQRAISSPLLDDISIQGARGVLINITGGSDLSLHEVNEAATLIQEEAHEDANIIFGAVIDDRMGDKLRITVIATGFGEVEAAALRPATESFLPHADVVGPAQMDFRSTTSPLPGAAARPSVREAPKRVVRMGLIVDGETPVWQRRKNEDPIEEPAAKVEDESEYDIPTFLRKQAD
jgi:cell division protein FtsZ